MSMTPAKWAGNNANGAAVATASGIGGMGTPGTGGASAPDDAANDALSTIFASSAEEAC